MATKKDLVEAYSFSRRRLVTAFVSGAPGGREVEPARPGRTIVGGVALAVLLAAGAAIAGVFAPRTPTDWTQAGLIVSKETGAAYVILPDRDGEAPTSSDQVELRPVINITSAKLILGADAEPTLISQDTIDDQRIGEDIGILGAPASVPGTDLLVESGWTACTADRAGMDVRVAAHPPVSRAPGRQLLVRSAGGLWLVAQPPDGDAGAPGAYVYRVPQQGSGGNKETDLLLLALHAGVAADAPQVPREWLDLFPRGGDLDWSSFDLRGIGDRADGAGDPGSGIPAGAVVGDVLTSSAGSALLTADGPITLDPFALAVYSHVETPIGVRKPRQVDQLPSRTFASAPYEDARWPTELLEPMSADVTPCAQLDAEHDRAPMARLAQATDPDAAAGIGPARKAVAVDPGRGAYVLSGGWDDTDHGAPYVIDAKGRANPLSGAGAAGQLGYDGYPVPVVPDSWLDLFDAGVELSTDAALCPPAEPGTERSSCR
jgi:type VII secretion protein EccB